MAESTGSRQTSIDEFWEINPNDSLTSDNNSEGLSVWCDKKHICSLEGKVRVGDILEFESSKLPCNKHWGIYIDELNFLPWNVVHFFPGNEEGRTYSDMQTCLNVSFPSSHDVLFVNTIYTLVSLPDGKVRINNVKDKDWSPLCKERICKEISYQLRELHKRCVFEQVNVYMCRVSFKNSEDFVDYCRYDRDHQHYMCLLNGEKITEWYSKAEIEDLIREVRVGDRLEFQCKSLYECWGIYIGQWGKDLEQLVHFNRNDENQETKSAMTCTGIGSSASVNAELCVESIGSVLGDGQVRINNGRDRTWPPLVGKDILDEINRQLPGKTHMCASKVSFKDSEDFVNYCRYDDLRINFGLVSDWCDSWQSLPRLRVGDRLEFHPTALPYMHWGIYVGQWGDDYHQIVHFAQVGGTGGIFSKKKFSPAKDKPVLSVNDIWTFPGKARINNERDHILPPFNKKYILDEIERQLKSQSDGYKPVYHVFTNNCEHFVNYCRYGIHHNDQVSIFARIRDRITEGLAGCSFEGQDEDNFEKLSSWFDKTQINELEVELRAGDRLEFSGHWRLYRHWGIFIEKLEGKLLVLHFTPGGNSSTFSMGKVSGSGSSAEGQPSYSFDLIEIPIGNNRVRINNTRDGRGRWQPLTQHEILDGLAHRLATQTLKGSTKYSVWHNNCEHLVNELRYFKHHCDQVHEVPNTGAIQEVV